MLDGLNTVFMQSFRINIDWTIYVKTRNINGYRTLQSVRECSDRRQWSPGWTTSHVLKQFVSTRSNWSDFFVYAFKGIITVQVIDQRDFGISTS